MAVTKIHAIKATVQAAVDYIADEDKTEGRLLVDSYCCGIESAAYDFKMANSLSERSDSKNLAFHLIQSFAPGEVSFDEAHQIGVEMADKLLEGKYSYVLATHINMEHVHNHLIFCATDNDEHKRYHDNKTSYYHLRDISDNLCKEHNLSIITPGIEKGKSYSEWMANNKNNSHKYILKRDILDSIRSAKSYEDFLNKMFHKGYVVKGYEFGEDAAKYISFKPPGYGNFIRGCYKNLGKGYTKEEIVERIEKQIESRRAWIEKQNNLPYYERNLIDTTQEKYVNNPRLKEWAENENFSIVASVYAKSGSMVELHDRIKDLKELEKDTRNEMVEIDKELKVLKEQIYYREIYDRNKLFHMEYINSKKKEQYLEQNETELILYDGANQFLKNVGINPKEVSLTDLKNRQNELLLRREGLKTDYDSYQADRSESERRLNILEKHFGSVDTFLEKARKKINHERGR